MGQQVLQLLRRAIVLHREIAHIKSQRMGINDKKSNQGVEGEGEGEAAQEEVEEGEVAKETQTKRNEAHKTDRQLAAPAKAEEGRRRGVQNWNEMPCQSIFAWHAASSQPPLPPISPSHITSRAPTMCDCQFQRHSRRCAGEKG